MDDRRRDESLAGTKPVQRTHRLSSGPRNVRQSVELDLNEYLGQKTGGFVLLRGVEPGSGEGSLGRRRRHPPHVYSVVQVTDLGLVAKVSAPDLLIWATSLHTAEPLEDVELRS